jgi:hypothetical protein
MRLVKSPGLSRYRNCLTLIPLVLILPHLTNPGFDLKIVRSARQMGTASSHPTRQLDLFF